MILHAGAAAGSSEEKSAKNACRGREHKSRPCAGASRGIGKTSFLPSIASQEERLTRTSTPRVTRTGGASSPAMGSVDMAMWVEEGGEWSLERMYLVKRGGGEVRGPPDRARSETERQTWAQEGDARYLRTWCIHPATLSPLTVRASCVGRGKQGLLG